MKNFLFSIFVMISIIKNYEIEMLKIRRDIYTLNDIQTFISSLNEMKDNGKYEKYGELHANIFENVHNNYFFLPWHRWFLIQFENELGMPIPFWNSSIDSGNEINSNIWTIFGSLGNDDTHCINGSFQNWTTHEKRCIRRNTINEVNGKHVANNTEISLFIYNDDLHFSTLLENGPHAYVHRLIGGDMSGFASPNDPIFWIHHAFIDRIWYIRQYCLFYNNDFENVDKEIVPFSNHSSIHDLTNLGILPYIYTNFIC
jgi:hypothetical protein